MREGSDAMHARMCPEGPPPAPMFLPSHSESHLVALMALFEPELLLSNSPRRLPNRCPGPSATSAVLASRSEEADRAEYWILLLLPPLREEEGDCDGKLGGWLVISRPKGTGKARQKRPVDAWERAAALQAKS